MSEAIITAIISAVASLAVAFGTWHVSIKKDREKQVTELKEILDAHRDEYLGKIRDVQDDIAGINANVQMQIALIDERIGTLSDRVERHNQVIDRTYHLEQTAAVHDEQIRVANHRIADLESGRHGA